MRRLTLLLSLLANAAPAAEPFADVHVHYNWDQEEIIAADEIADRLRRLLGQCAKVTIELSTRDPWRYGGLTGADGRLLPGWRDQILQYPARFVTGTDPVWRVTRTQAWDQASDRRRTGHNC